MIARFLFVTVLAASAARAQSEAATSARMDSLHGDSARLTAFLRDMPKGGDLHNHLSGWIPAESWARWAAEDGVCFVTSNATLSRPPCNAPGRVPAARLLSDSAIRLQAIDAWSMHDWTPGGAESGADHFFATFNKTSAIGLSHLGDMLAEIASAAAAQHVSYLELMMNPDEGSVPRLGLQIRRDAGVEHMRSKVIALGLRDSLRTASRVVDGAERRMRERLECGTPAADPGCGVTMRYIYQVIRSRSPELVFAQIVGGFEWPAIDPRFVSFNLVAPEHGQVAVQDFDLHMHMIDSVRGSYPNARITLHAGELSGAVTNRATMRAHIRESVEVGHANRIGHGVDVLSEDDAEGLLREMAARRVLVEVALTSNDVILGVRGPAHPLAAYLSHGVPVALATDDAGVSRTDWTHEFYRAVAEQHVGYSTLKMMARNSIAYSFADDSTKARLARELDAAFARFERR